jgi:hypothetical protein
MLIKRNSKAMTTEEVKAAKRQWYIDWDKEKERHEKAIKELEQRSAEIKRACPHEEASSYSGVQYDSAGYSCDTCGKDLGYNPPPKQCRIIC